MRIRDWCSGVCSADLLGRQVDLIATLDDATSELCSAFLVEEEGTASTFRALHAVIAAKGLFSSLYTDRGSQYFHTARAAGRVHRDHSRQIGREISHWTCRARVCLQVKISVVGS